MPASELHREHTYQYKTRRVHEYCIENAYEATLKVLIVIIERMDFH